MPTLGQQQVECLGLGRGSDETTLRSRFNRVLETRPTEGETKDLLGFLRAL